MHIFAKMITLAIVLLMLLGVGLILVEFFITPGFIVGVLGVLCIAYAIYFGYQHLPTWQAHTYMAIGVFATLYLGVKLLTGTTYSRIANKDIIEGKMNRRDLLNLEVGMKGTTLSALRPSGNALFDNKKCEVLTEGDFVYANTEIKIIKIEQDKVFVKPV